MEGLVKLLALIGMAAQEFRTSLGPLPAQTNLNALSVQCRCSAAGCGCSTFGTVGQLALLAADYCSALGSWELTTASFTR